MLCYTQIHVTVENLLTAEEIGRYYGLVTNSQDIKTDVNLFDFGFKTGVSRISTDLAGPGQCLVFTRHLLNLKL